MYIRLKDLRQTLGKFQSEFAAVMKTKQNTISRMETKDYTKISIVQYNALCEAYGKDKVDGFLSEYPFAPTINGNTNIGNGTQNNEMFTQTAGHDTLIKNLADTMTRVMEKQAEQTDRLLDLLTKLSEKL